MYWTFVLLSNPISFNLKIKKCITASKIFRCYYKSIDIKIKLMFVIYLFFYWGSSSRFRFSITIDASGNISIITFPKISVI